MAALYPTLCRTLDGARIAGIQHPNEGNEFGYVLKRNHDGGGSYWSTYSVYPIDALDVDRQNPSYVYAIHSIPHSYNGQWYTDIGLYILNPVNGNDIYHHTIAFQSYTDNGNAIALDTDGSYFITGSTSSFGKGKTHPSSVEPDSDIFLLKCSPNGQIQWIRTWHGTGTGDDIGYDVICGNGYGSEEDVFVVGSTESHSGSSELDGVVLRFEKSSGYCKFLETKLIGFGNEQDDVAYGCTIYHEYLYVTGYKTMSDAFHDYKTTFIFGYNMMNNMVQNIGQYWSGYYNPYNPNWHYDNIGYSIVIADDPELEIEDPHAYITGMAVVPDIGDSKELGYFNKFDLFPDYCWDFINYIDGDGGADETCGQDIALRFDDNNDLICLYVTGYQGKANPTFHHVAFLARYSPWGDCDSFCNEVYGGTEDEKGYSCLYRQYIPEAYAVYHQIVVAASYGDMAEAIEYYDNGGAITRGLYYNSWKGSLVDSATASGLIFKTAGTPPTDQYIFVGTAYSSNLQPTIEAVESYNIQITKLIWTYDDGFNIDSHLEYG